MRFITFNSLFVLCAALVLQSCAMFEGDSKEAHLTNDWKMIKETKDGKEIKPKHDNLVFEFNKKDNEYSFTADFEETHTGTWEFNEDKTAVILNDVDTKKSQTLPIKELDRTHLALSGFDGKGTVIYMTPLKNKDSRELTHKEHLVAKKWHIFESDNPENLATLFEFKTDKTFIIIPYQQKVPVFSGNWELSDDNKKLIIDRREDGEHLELDIEKLSRHEMVLKDSESGAVNKFHDRDLWEKEREEVETEASEEIKE